MNRRTYRMLEQFMHSCMEDSAHDTEHVYRVLYNALEIARTEPQADHDVLICTALLHDIGRKKQFENPALCHAEVGGYMAYSFLTEHGFNPCFAEHVRQCIRTHRYRKNRALESLEAKIIFDADKLDATGTVGIARTLLYKGAVSEPLYSVLPDGTVSNGKNDTKPSFFQEYKFKLEHVYDSFYTARAAEIAAERRKAAESFYLALYREVNVPPLAGKNFSLYNKSRSKPV